MSVFEHRSFDQHEQVLFVNNETSGLKAIIAIHNTHLGPALGGCRMYPYGSDDEALDDVLRLSRGMTYKSAIARLPLGGGKSVIVGDPSREKTPELLAAMAQALEQLQGRYVAAEDAGMCEADIRQMAKVTQHVAGYREAGLGRGDPSPVTAYGVFQSIKLSLKYQLKCDHLRGVRVALQGLGNVGGRLAALLHQAGAQLWVSDLDESKLQWAEKELAAKAVSGEELMAQPVELFSPCAMGAVIDDVTINRLQAAVVCGSANNQLASDDLGRALQVREILYAPDYVVNCGGLIDVYYQRCGQTLHRSQLHANKIIRNTLTEIFRCADRTGRPTNEVADHLARVRLGGGSPVGRAA